jgi:hypothetical protein
VAPDVRNVHGTMGQKITDRLYLAILRYCINKKNNLIGLQTVKGSLKTLDLHGKKSLAPEMSQCLWDDYSKKHPDHEELRFFEVCKVDLSRSSRHYCFELREKDYYAKVPKSLELKQGEVERLAQATVRMLSWLSQKKNVMYLKYYYENRKKDFNPLLYKQKIERASDFRGSLPHGVETNRISRKTAQKDVLRALAGIAGLGADDRQALVLDCNLAILLSYVLAYNEVLGAERLWSMLYESSEDDRQEQTRIRVTFDPTNFVTWAPRNYLPSPGWE